MVLFGSVNCFCNLRKYSWEILNGSKHAHDIQCHGPSSVKNKITSLVDKYLDLMLSLWVSMEDASLKIWKMIQELSISWHLVLVVYEFSKKTVCCWLQFPSFAHQCWDNFNIIVVVEGEVKCTWLVILEGQNACSVVSFVSAFLHMTSLSGL